jgi:hypothetical protein
MSSSPRPAAGSRPGGSGRADRAGGRARAGKTLKRGPRQRIVEGWSFRLADEVRYIQRRAADHDSPVTGLGGNAIELSTQLFGDLSAFLYHCFDRIVIYGYLSHLSRPEQVVHFFRDVVGVATVSKEVLSQAVPTIRPLGGSVRPQC